MNETVENLIAFCSQNNRVCPVLDQWEIMHRLLPLGMNRWPVPPPQSATNDAERRALLREHIERAEESGGLNNIGTFLRNLQEDQWRHFGE